jgi:hypothetical protein
MKFRVVMKDPDTLHDAISDAVDTELNKIELDEEEHAALAEVRREKIRELCNAWFEHDEYLTVEIDTESKTCLVVAVK